MSSIAAKLSRGIARRRTPRGIAGARLVFSSLCTPPAPQQQFLSLSSPTVRLLSVAPIGFTINPVVPQVISYAFSLARSEKSEESYGQSFLVLEQCENNQTDDNSKALVLLAMSTLLSERGNTDEAIQKLQRINDLKVSSVPVRVAASEALVGLHLELCEDDTSSVLADICLQSLDAITLELGIDFGILNARARALKGFVEVVRGNLESSGLYFEGAPDNLSKFGNAALSYAEHLHVIQNYLAAKELYKKVIEGISASKGFSEPFNLSAGNMAWEDVLLAATCASGQLEGHIGNFADAEEILTGALMMAEDRFGSHHLKVGVVLTCIALMFRRKATVEQSSSFLIQEGLYRKAIDLLKAPQLETEGAESKVCRRDIVALARGGYAETLCVQQNRKAEGERMKSWAEAAWRSRRLSLAEALDVSGYSSKVPVIDARISHSL